MLLGVTVAAGAEESALMRVYAGTYTSGASEGIYLLELDAGTGALTLRGVAAAMENPSYLALHPALPVLYAVGEAGAEATGDGGVVRAFAVAPDTGLLQDLGAQSTRGAAPCHVAVAPSGKHVAVANYMGGSVALFPVAEQGALGPAHAFVQHAGHSVNAQRQEAPHAHSVTFAGSGRYLLAADLGIDQVLVYRYDAEAGTLAPNAPPFAALPAGAGPRHVAVHPSGKFVYVVNELDSSVAVFGFDADQGRLSPLQQISTLPQDFKGSSTTAAIRVHPSGKTLYASNRGHDSIAVFRIDPETGLLTARGQTPTGGKTPRDFNLDPEGRYLLAANQDSDSIVVFRVAPETGALSPVGAPVAVPMPVCVVFAGR